MINVLNNVMDDESFLGAQDKSWKISSKKNPSQPILYKSPPLAQSSPMAFLPVAKNVFWKLLLLAYLDLTVSSRHLLLKAENLVISVFGLAKKSLSFLLITLVNRKECRPVLTGRIEKCLRAIKKIYYLSARQKILLNPYVQQRVSSFCLHF